MGLYQTIFIVSLFNIYPMYNCEEQSDPLMCRCPVGFQHQSRDAWQSTCLLVKTPDTFFNKNKDCFRNLLPINFYTYRDIEYIKSTNVLYWTDYKRSYENGSFINWKFVDSNIGKPQLNVVEKNPINGSDMCAVVNITTGTLYAVSCYDKYHSLCNVKEYEFLTKLNSCPPGYSLLFGSPIPTCLRLVVDDLPGKSSSEVESLCKSHSGYLLQQGYIYTMHPDIQNSSRESMPEYPIGITKSKQGVDWLVPNDITGRYTEIPPNNWENITEFSNVSFKNNMFFVNTPEHTYRNYLCEYVPKILDVKMSLTMNRSEVNVRSDFLYSLLLELDREVQVYEIRCFTDSLTYYPTPVSVTSLISNDMSSKMFIVDGISNGYYWCTLMDNIYYKQTESNKILFLPNGKASYWLMSYLLEFLNQFNQTEMEKIIKNDFPSAIYKRIYKNNTILIHSKYTIIHDHVGYTVLFARHLQYCEGFDTYPTTDIGSVVGKQSPPTGHYRCQGDYNVGGFWEKVDTFDTKAKYIYSETTTTPMYSEEVNNLINNLQSMLNSKVEPDDLESAMDDMNSVLLLKDSNIPQTVAGSFDDLLNAVEIPADQTYMKIIQSNIAVLVAKRQGPAPVIGIKVRNIGEDGINEDTIEPLTEDDTLDPDLYDSNDDIVAKVSSSICHGDSGKLSFTLFKDDAAFPKENNSDWEVNSRVLSISLDNKTCFKKSDYIDIYFKPYDNRQSNKKKACAYWDFDNGNWTTNICILLPPEKLRDLDICRCYHMTHFSQIVTYSNNESTGFKDYKLFLYTIIYMNFILSLIGLIVIFLTGVLSKAWSNELSNQILLNLSLSIVFLLLIFLIILMIDFTSHNPSVCIFTGILFHFAILSSFFWIFLSVFKSHRKIKSLLAENLTYSAKKVRIFGWIIPVLPVIAVLCFDRDTYLLNFKQGKSQIDLCFPTGVGYWLTVFIPISFVTGTIVSKYCSIVYNTYIRKNIADDFDYKVVMRNESTRFFLVLIYHVTWTLGIFTDKMNLLCMFCLIATAKGLLLFMFVFIGNKNIRNIWSKFLTAKYNIYFPIKSEESKIKSNLDDDSPR